MKIVSFLAGAGGHTLIHPQAPKMKFIGFNIAA
jgi:hypothetical protein